MEFSNEFDSLIPCWSEGPGSLDFTGFPGFSFLPENGSAT